MYVSSPLLLPSLTNKINLKDLYLMTSDISQKRRSIIPSEADTHPNKGCQWCYAFSSSLYMNSIDLEEDEVRDPHHVSSLVWTICFQLAFPHVT